jgi:hypothetical protein
LGVSMAALAHGSADHDPAPVVSSSQDEHAQNPLDDVLIERAKQALVTRYGFLPGEAFDVLAGLAHSQQRAIEEFAESVVRSDGRLDGELGSDRDESVTDALQEQQRLATPITAELLVEAPSAASAFLLAGSLADYAARAVPEDGAWRVVVQRCSSTAGGVPGALSRVRTWLAECGFPTASVTLNGETYLLDGSLDGNANGKQRNSRARTSAGQETN